MAHAGLKALISRIVLHPGFMIPVFLMSFYGIYLSGTADALLPTWCGHVGLELLFLISGVILTVSLLSTDSLPARQSHFGRFVDVIAEMPLHAFCGVVVMMASDPLVDFYANPPGAWDVDPMADQLLAGGLAWSYGELPSVLMLMFILVRWQRDDAAASKAKDKQENTRGTPELDAYNDYLRQLRHRSERYES